MMEPIIKLEDVWKIYQLGKVELVALKGVSLEIPPGSFISIMGPSGSGKSTFLNMISALDFPTKGKVYLKNKDISLLSENELSLLRGKTIGFVFQEFNILPNLTALENVVLPMIFQSVSDKKEKAEPLQKEFLNERVLSAKEREERAKELLVLVGLENRIFHQPAELSAGERQRVAVARAFANNPELVIADEPTGNLDSLTGKKIMEILTGFHQKEGKTIVVVTHDLNIAKYGEQIINIKDGQIVVNSRENT